MIDNQFDLLQELIYNQYGGKGEKKWSTLKHNGVMFTEPYKPHMIPIIYNGKKIVLDSDSEEFATIYAKVLETEYVNNKTFRKNFFKDWSKFLKKGGFKEITELDKCDFSLILDHIVKQREIKQNMSKEDKLKLKEENDKLEEKYKIAIVDSKEQPVGNYKMEPPGLFLGRGCHPKAGKIKRRVYPEDITINIGEKEKIPEMPPFYTNHKWNKIIHDDTLEWLASWKDEITGKTKYVWLGAKSDFKAKSDQSKFDNARKLGKNIVEIRRSNFNNIIDKSVDEKTKQLATALYLIDHLALRVGNEKSEDEADTVGVCSLRVEHIKLLEDGTSISLDFLGKDSVRYQNTTKIEPEVYLALTRFLKNKKKGDELFDLINPQLLNTYLKSMMDNLTAKVFRTYNASNTFQEELDKISDIIDKDKDTDNKINTILNMYNKANIKVAMLCNHQKNVSKSFNDQLSNLKSKINEYKDKRTKLLDERKELEKDKTKNKEKINRINKKLEKVKSKIKQNEAKKDIKLEMKNLSLGTSKTNYIDPRITVAFFKKHNIPIEKIFSQNLREKFFWAMDVDPSWSF